MTRKEYRRNKRNNFNKWFLIRFAQAFAYIAMFLVIEFILLVIFALASHQHYQKLEMIKTGQYTGER